VRAALETHVRAEEADIWPLFAENFTVEEQSALVGAVIGRTGAVVLEALIPWVMGSFSEYEKAAMMDSLRKATENTHFDKWMAKMVPLDVAAAMGGTAALSDVAAGGGGGVGGSLPVGFAPWAPPPPVGGSRAQESKAIADTTAYRPGWDDIFRMNAKQLEAAAAATATFTADEDEHRRSYLVRNLMVSRFLVAQQQRMRMQASTAPAAAAAAPLPSVSPAAGGCDHYSSNCMLVASCCGREFACRICHDEGGQGCGQPFDRYGVREMRCKLCGEQQPVAQQCSSCKRCMAHYYCGVCHLFDDDSGASLHLLLQPLVQGCPGLLPLKCRRCDDGSAASVQQRCNSLPGAFTPIACLHDITPCLCRQGHLPLPLLQHVPPRQGPRYRLLPLHDVQRVHVPRAVQQAHLSGAGNGVQLPHLPRGPLSERHPCEGAPLWPLHAQQLFRRVHPARLHMPRVL
jgi:hypothetical protein